MTSFKRTVQYSALTLALLTGSVAVNAQPVEIDHVVAVVNNDIVLQSELDKRIRLVTEQISAKGQQLPPADVIQKQVMQRLIMEHIQLELAQQQGIRVSETELNGYINNIAQQNGMTLEQFRDSLIAEGQIWADAREQIRREILLARIQQTSVNRRISVSEQEIRNFLKSSEAQDQSAFKLRNILIAIPEQASRADQQAAQAKAQKILTALDQGKSFAELATANSDAGNALQGGELGWRKADELPAELADHLKTLQKGQHTAPIATPSGYLILQVEDRKGQQQAVIDQTKVRHILITTNEIRDKSQAKDLVNSLYTRLQQGQPFDQLARQYSDDPGSGSQGGELGWTSPGQMVPEFEQVMKDTAVGGISKPFQSRFGWHILQVEDRRKTNMETQMNENRAREMLRKRKYGEELESWLQEIRAKAFVDIKG